MMPRDNLTDCHSMRDLMQIVEAGKLAVTEVPMDQEYRDPDTREWITPAPPQIGTVEINGVRRPLYNSKNLLIAPTLDTQIAFWRWFGKSKVVDQHGRPLVVFRGDQIGKSEFSGREDPSNYIQGNIFFTNDMDIAKGYSPHRTNSYISSKDMNETHGVYSRYLKIERPVTIDARGGDWSRIPLFGRLKKALDCDALQIDAIALYVQQHTKNDGLIAKNVWDQFGDGHQYVVFSGAQIKQL